MNISKTQFTHTKGLLLLMSKKNVCTALLAFLLIGTTLIPTASVFAAQESTSADTTDSEWMSEDDSTNVDEDTYSDEDIDPALLEEYEQLLDYADDVAVLADYENKSVDKLNTFHGFGTSNRKQAYTALTKTIIPNYNMFLKGMKKIQTDNKEIASMQKVYIKGASLNLQGMKLIQKGLSTSKVNYTSVQKGIQLIAQGGDLVEQFNDRFANYIIKFQ